MLLGQKQNGVDRKGAGWGGKNVQGIHTHYVYSFVKNRVSSAISQFLLHKVLLICAVYVE
jgi:hypothetical protein